MEERKGRRRVTSSIRQVKVVGELPEISDDTLILPEWIEAAQSGHSTCAAPDHRSRNCSLGEDETAIMRRER